MDTQVAETVRRIETLFKEQYNEFVTERVKECTAPVTNNSPEQVVTIWPPVKSKSKHKEQLAALKSDCGLFSRLYISYQTRDGDMDNFSSHENQAAPPALSTGGEMWIGVKADLICCLESDLPEYM